MKKIFCIIAFFIISSSFAWANLFSEIDLREVRSSIQFAKIGDFNFTYSSEDFEILFRVYQNSEFSISQNHALKQKVKKVGQQVLSDAKKIYGKRKNNYQTLFDQLPYIVVLADSPQRPARAMTSYLILEEGEKLPFVQIGESALLETQNQLNAKLESSLNDSKTVYTPNKQQENTKLSDQYLYFILAHEFAHIYYDLDRSIYYSKAWNQLNAQERADYNIDLLNIKSSLAYAQHFLNPDFDILLSEKLRIEIAQNMSLNANQFYAFNQCLEKSKSLHLPNLNRVANLDSHQYEFQNAEYPVILSEIKNFENNFEKCLIEVNFNLNEIEKMNEIYQQLNPKQKNKDFSYSDFKQSVKELKVKTRKKYYQLQAQKVAAYSGEDLADHFAASLVNFRFKNKNVYREIFIEENFYFPNRNIKCDIKDINLNIQDFGLLYNIHRPSCWRYKSIINFLMKYKKHPALL